jgi:hypothetical protein
MKKTAVTIALTLGTLGPVTVHAEASAQPNAVYSAERFYTDQSFQAVKNGALQTNNRKSPVLDIPTALGMDRGQLRQHLHSGKSLLEVAQSFGLTGADLQIRLLNQLRKKIDLDVQSGNISLAKRDVTLERFLTYFGQMLEYINV